jgi:hypothetical protein
MKIFDYNSSKEFIMGKNLANMIDDEDMDIPDDEWEAKELREKLNKKVNGKKKGDTYERIVAKDLSKRFNDVFRRVPQSGAFMGGNNRFRNKDLRKDAQEILAGDLICPQWFPLIIECKNYKNTPKLQNLMTIGDKEFDEWVRQAKLESETSGKDWVIIFKITSMRGKQFVALDHKVFDSKVNTRTDRYLMYEGTIIIEYNEFFEKHFQHFYDSRKPSEFLESKNKDDMIELDKDIEDKILPK